MNFTEGFRKKEFVEYLITRIAGNIPRKIKLMEVCGGHTMAIRRYGIHSLLPADIELLSGPGCPVCVTAQDYIDGAVAYAKLPDVITVSYGDLLRIPGTKSSLESCRAGGCDVRIISSTLEALNIAKDNPGKKVIFMAIGFETTVPGTAVAILEAKNSGLNNFFVMNAHKTMPAAMAALIDEGIPIDGYIGPGHVCAVAGSSIFNDLALKYHVPVVISGFEPVDLVQAIYMLVKMISEKRAEVEIQYSRLVTSEGNRKAQKMIEEVFEPSTQTWRGIGAIQNSGLRIREQYAAFDIERQYPVKTEPSEEPRGCLCGQVLKGLVKPDKCKLFGKNCTPLHPVGACMVSPEGACNAYYNYRSI